MRLDPGWWRRQVVRPALERVGLWSESAEVLLVGTALAESRLSWLRQLGGGPALGPYQVEPATHRSLWADLLRYRLQLAVDVLELAGGTASDLPTYRWTALADRLQHHLVASTHTTSIPQMWWYATAVARCRYLWDRNPLPPADDPEALAAYYVRVYNAGGKATIEGSTKHMQEAIAA